MSKILPIHFLRLFVIVGIGFSCNHSDDHQPSSDPEINNFIWKGLNSWYYWQQEVPLLNDVVAHQDSYITLLKSYSNPSEFFYSLLNNYPHTDQFSWVVSNYNSLLANFQGSNYSMGFELGLKPISPNAPEIFGYVKYIIPGSNAEWEGFQRGDIFTKVNGIPLTTHNYIDLLYSSSSFSVELADYNNGNITSNGIHKNVVRQQLYENPVYFKNVYSWGNKRVGYLVYNGFIFTYNQSLDEAFAYFQSQNITDLILDLRYNSGGSVETANFLASMIYPSPGAEFARLEFNSKHQNRNTSYTLVNEYKNYDSSGNFIGNQALHSVQIDQLIVLCTFSTASASELLINGLKPYKNPILMGTVTRGKNVGSITLFDSPNSDYVNKNSANPNHKWAMQPIAFQTFNALGNSDYGNGFIPDIEINETEYLQQWFPLGDIQEVMLSQALSVITGLEQLPPHLRNVHSQGEELSIEDPFNPGKNSLYLPLN